MVTALYISGNAVDLAPKTEFPLEWRSAIEGKLEEVLSDGSYTITIPKTARNRKIFADAFVPAKHVRGRFVPARFEINGFDALKNCYAILLASPYNGYEIALKWGKAGLYNAWLNAEYKLKDTFETELLDQWGDSDWSQAADSTKLMFRPKYRAGSFETSVVLNSARKAVAATMPASNVLALVNGIATKRGLSIQVPSRTRELLRETALLLTTRNNSDYAMSTAISGTRWTYDCLSSRMYPSFTSSYGLRVPHKNSVQEAQVDLSNTDYFRGIDTSGDTRWVYSTNESELHLRLKGTVGSEYFAVEPDQIQLDVIGIKDNQTTLLHSFTPTITYGERGLYTVSFDLSKDIECEEYSRITFYLNGAIRPIEQSWSSNAPMDGFITDAVETLTPEDPYPLGVNLPDMSETEFLNAVAAYAGCFVDFADGGLAFVPYDDLFSGKRQGAEYRGKVQVESEDEYGSYEFSFGDMAQRNRFDYTADEENGGATAYGEVVVADKSLAPQTDYYESPFAASRGAIVKQWELTYENNTLKEAQFTEVTHRLMHIGKDGTLATVKFDSSMRWDSILSNRYREYQRVFKQPTVVSASMYLNEKELRELDLTRSHYIAELGHEYVIIKAQWSSSDEVTDVELLQI